MCEVIDKFVERGRIQGIEQGIEQGRTDYAKSFAKVSIAQGQPQQYILNMLHTCFQYSEENAWQLYKECTD